MGELLSRQRDRPFDKIEWITNPDMVNGNPRAKMIASVTGDKLARGLTRPQVLELLGKPNEMDGLNMVYYLGAQFNSVGFLEVFIDEQDSVESFQIVWD
jgi:outer membrane protein assembly factor BamE (lipoprotein component of BamABCDE complex)